MSGREATVAEPMRDDVFASYQHRVRRKQGFTWCDCVAMVAEIERLRLVVNMWEEYFEDNEADARHVCIAELKAEIERLKKERDEWREKETRRLASAAGRGIGWGQ